VRLFLFFWSFSYSAFSQGDIDCGPVIISPEVNSIAQPLCLFSRPLIVGASVSAGHLANPGGAPAMISKSLNPGAEVTSIAHVDKTSIQSLTMGKNNVPYNKIPETPSVVIGIDLFFWDARNEECGTEFVKHTEDFFSFYQDKKVPMIIGRLPQGLSQPAGYAALNGSDCAKTINLLLEKLCLPEKNCSLYNPADCFTKLKREAAEKFGTGQESLRRDYLKKKYSEFFVDDKHPSEAGNKYCADAYIESKSYQELNCE
jgi:hypothetical protein